MQNILKDLGYFVGTPNILNKTRKFEIVGEAIKNIPESTRKEYPNITWKAYAGMRDILIHEYFGVDLNIVWNLIMEELPFIKK